MIPENLRKQWELAQSRAELLFLVDHGGGFPDSLACPELTPAGRRVILSRMGFRVAEEYDMPSFEDWDVREPWVRLTNGTAINLSDGFVVRSETGRRRK